MYVARNAHLTIDIIDSSLDIAQLVKLKISEADETEFNNVYYAIMMVKKMTPLEYQT